ncbi:MAG: DnaD domain protein [Pseudobutyrivibrio sp.]|nr:DnaD domain protein [Pseudobutyrivibrio sp.]
MADIMLHTSEGTGVTCVSNAFIDNFMKDANGEFVKIYLYLLRSLNKDGYEFSISQLADCLDHTEKDVLRAFTYWEKVGLLRLEYNDLNELSGIYFVDVQGHDRLGKVPAPSSSPAAPLPIENTFVKPNYTPDELQAFQSDSEVSDLLFCTQTYIGRPLSSTETSTILFWFEGLHMNIDLIQYLIESSIDNGHKSFHYMNKTALNWTESGITTVDQARTTSKSHLAIVYAVKKSMGISGRDLIPTELEYVDKWANKYRFSKDIITEACKRTILATNKPQFSYADSILTGWNNSSVKNMDDISKLDEQFIAASTAKLAATNSRSTSSATPARAKASNNKFNKFSQRDIDYDALFEKKISSN